MPVTFPFRYQAIADALPLLRRSSHSRRLGLQHGFRHAFDRDPVRRFVARDRKRQQADQLYHRDPEVADARQPDSAEIACKLNLSYLVNRWGTIRQVNPQRFR